MTDRPAHIHLPSLYSVDQRTGKHRILRAAELTERAFDTAAVEQLRSGRIRLKVGENWIVDRRTDAPSDADHVLLLRGLELPADDRIEIAESDLRWSRPRSLEMDRLEISAQAKSATRSWSSHQIFAPPTDQSPGLRNAQRGALHALIAHWTIAREDATVVLPTGTGKTDTMIAAMMCERFHPLLVVVPSRALRGQTAAKFERLGKIRELGLCQDAENPVVAIIDGGIRTAEELDLILRCNVIVTTIGSINEAPEEFARRLADDVQHVFFDEAHHIPAKSWSRFYSRFTANRVSQFTATPYRNDGKLVPGRRVYRYPLRKAQDDKLFTSIKFRPVVKYDLRDSDLAIRDIALAQLESDSQGNLDHIIMVRADTQARAEHLEQLYSETATVGVRLLHSNLTKRERTAALNDLWSRKCRVIVCVDMLGEGFDLPALKIAAIHDSHQSLGITLQFVGRFTREGSKVGEATAIANIADPKLSDNLDRLYAEDSDWNHILRNLADDQIEIDQERVDFLDGFDFGEAVISLQNVRPKMSTAIYRCSGGTWNSAALIAEFPRKKLHFVSANEEHTTAVIITKREERVSWGEIEDLRDTTYDLTLVYFDAERDLIFIHTSDTRRYHTHLAEKASGVTARIIDGMDVFRSLNGIQRLFVANLGLKSGFGRSLAFTMYAGGNVNEGLSEQSFRNRLTSNIFGFGFENGDRASVGCSYKGRIWSYRVSSDISEWVRWCKRVGQKVTDTSIDATAFLRTRMVVNSIDKIPSDLHPISIEWSSNIWIRSEDAIEIRFGETIASTLLDVSINIISPGEPGKVTFRIYTEHRSSEFELDVSGSEESYTQISGEKVAIRMGRSSWSDIREWLKEEPPTTFFSNGQQLVGKLLLSKPVTDQTFDKSKIKVWDWNGVDPKKESQRDAKRTDSIQYHVIQNAIGSGLWQIIFDDDEAGESADVVLIRHEESRIEIQLHHCKYAHGSVSAQRVDDVYEVCGQAQKSVHWKGDSDRLFEHLAKRESRRSEKMRPSRFIHGTLEQLAQLRRMARRMRVDVEIYIVQPGLSSSKLTPDQAEVLAATELFLKETFAVPLHVIGGK